MTEPVPCRFAELGCQSPAAAIVHVPQGCICWTDPVQALCHQHLLTMESAGPSTVIVELDPAVSPLLHPRGGR